MEHANATQYARQLAKYIKDPSTILARVRDYYDTRIPTLETVKRFQREANPKPRVSVPKGKEYRERESDGEDFAVKGLVKPPKVRKARRSAVQFMPRKDPWPSWYKPPAPRSIQYMLPQQALLASVARYHDVSVDDIMGGDRHAAFVDARRIIAAVLMARGWSYPRVGKFIGRRDHSTIINLCETLNGRLRQSEFLRISLNYHMAEFGQRERLAA